MNKSGVSGITFFYTLEHNMHKQTTAVLALREMLIVWVTCSLLIRFEYSQL